MDRRIAARIATSELLFEGSAAYHRETISSMAVLAKIAMECLHDPLAWLFVASLAFVILQIPRLGRAPFPPGPKPLPIISNMALVDQLTHRGLGALAKQYGGLLHLRLGWLHVFAVSTPEYAREVLHAQDGAFSNRAATIAVVYLTYGRSDVRNKHGVVSTSYTGRIRMCSPGRSSVHILVC
jgi:hypothetical protein